MTTRSSALALSTSILVALSACSAGPDAATTPPSPDPTSAGASTSAGATPPSEPAMPSAGPTPVPPLPPAPGSVDTPAEAAAWEALMSPVGEYASAAAYTAVIDRYGQVRPYTWIKEQEDRHIGALTRQLERLGVVVPANPYLGNLLAPDDLATAARAWADGEVANVALYDRLLEQATGDAQLTRVFTNLRRASAEIHLPAFEAAAAHGGTAP